MEIENNGKYIKIQHYDRLIKEKYIKVNVLDILSDPHPEKIEDYAIHLFYKANNHAFFTCSNNIPLNNELVKLIIEDKEKYIVNVRTGEIRKE